MKTRLTRAKAGAGAVFTAPHLESAGGPAAPGAILLGDVNHDNDINAQDVQLVINAALGLEIGVKVPDLTGMTEGEASGALAFAYLTVGDVTSETSATVPAGHILRQDPAAGASVAPETAVAIVLSAGPPPSTGWTYIPSQTSVWGLKIEQTSDGGFFVAGSSYVGQYNLASVLKTDAAGNLEFCQVINDNARAYDQDIMAGQQTADGGFVISGYSDNGSPHGYLALLIKLDTDGLLEWSKTYQCVELGYGATSYAVTQTADGGYVLGGMLVNDITKALNHGPWLAKTDEDGELVWMRAYGGSATVYDLRDIEETPQGDLVVSGNKSGKLILSKFTANGDLLWNFSMTELPSATGHDLELTPDGGCILVGSGVTGGPTVVVKINNVYLPE